MTTCQVIQTPVFEWDGIKVLPLLHESTIGTESLLKWMPVINPDMVITLFDAWCFPPGWGKSLGCWYPMAPIDHAQIPTDVLARLKEGVRPIAYSKNAFELEKAAGLNPAYIPHGVDTKVYKPSESLDLGKGKFVVGIIATNVDSRKAWNEQLHAFADFHKKHPDSILYAHTNPMSGNKYNLVKLAVQLGLTQDDILWADKDILNYGIEDDKMAQLYSSFDVLLSATAGEGFGIPILEAQSCGTSVIVNNTTAMPELCGAGWITDVAYPPQWTNQDAFWEFPSVPSIVEKLELAYENRGNKELKEKAREFALGYDFDVLYDTYFAPFLDEETERMEHDKKNPRHIHKWSQLGLNFPDGHSLFPCTGKDCGAAIFIYPDGKREVKEDAGFSTTIHGTKLELRDDSLSSVVKIICREAEEQYKLDLDYKDGDVILDVGAHVGVISTYLGMKYPNTKIISVEPHPTNYKNLIRNLKVNKVKNATLLNKAVTSDGRKVTIFADIDKNSGGSGLYGNGEAVEIDSMTLAEIFKVYNVDRVKLLKMDCEGAEYEILYASQDLLDRIDNLSIEIHNSQTLKDLGYESDKLLAMLKKHIPEDKITFNVCKIYDQKTIPSDEREAGQEQGKPSA
jgi:FkbM family methyltransferase